MKYTRNVRYICVYRRGQKSALARFCALLRAWLFAGQSRNGRCRKRCQKGVRRCQKSDKFSIYSIYIYIYINIYIILYIKARERKHGFMMPLGGSG